MLKKRIFEKKIQNWNFDYQERQREIKFRLIG